MKNRQIVGLHFLFSFLIISCRIPSAPLNNYGYDFYQVADFDEETILVDRFFMLNDSTGWIVGAAYKWEERDGLLVPVPQKTIVLRTKNRWVTFEQSEYLYFNLIDLYFINDSTGWITGLESGLLLESRNGGATWVERNIGAVIPLIYINFKDTRRGWITCDDAIFQTEDGGETWAPVNYVDNLRFSQIRFLSPSLGFCVGESDRWNNGFYRTSDGGKSWELIVPFINTGIMDFYTNDGAHFLGVDQVFMSSSDSARTWEIINYEVSGSYIEFLTPLHGLVMGYGDTWLTDNGGSTWYQGAFETEPVKAPAVKDYSIVSDNNLYILAGNSIWVHYPDK